MPVYNMQVYNETRNVALVTQGQVARTFWARLRGLIGRRKLAEGEGLLLEPCNSVHCLFMAFPIDVIYLDRTNRVVDVDPDLRPGHIGWPRRRAVRVLEVPAGTVARTGTRPGDRLRIHRDGLELDGSVQGPGEKEALGREGAERPWAHRHMEGREEEARSRTP